MHKNTINNCPYCGEELSYVPREGVPHLCMVEIGARNKADKIRENKFAAAEGLLNHIEDHFRLHGQKLRMQIIADIVRYSERIYDSARQDEMETVKCRTKQ